MVRISLRTDYSSKGNMLHQCSVDFGIKQFARALGGILCLGLLHPLEALALEAAKYDYVAVGAGWQRFDADQVSVDGEIYTGQLSWAVAKQAELTFRAVAGQFEESVDVLDAAIGGQFHYPFGLRTDVNWGVEIVSRERSGQGVSDEATVDLYGGFRFWPTQDWEVSARLTLVDTVESADTASSISIYYALDKALSVGAQLSEQNDAETLQFIARWSWQ